MLVIAYNRDTDSFFHIAEALARVMYCNVLVCNTGYFGGSVAVSPYYEPWRRTVYRHNGGRMLATQVISLPVDSLNKAQLGNPQKGPDSCVKQLFKALLGWPRTTARRSLNQRRVALD